MIYEMNKSDFYRCNSLLHELGQLEARAVVEGVAPGRIFVDNIDAPVSGFIWLGNNDGFIFIGDEQNLAFTLEINNFIDTFIIAEAHKVGLSCFEAIGNHSKWVNIIERIFSHRHLESWNQRVYTLNSDGYKALDLLPLEEGYSVVKLTKDLYDNQAISNIDFLSDTILDFWSNSDEFFQNGIAYVVIFQDEIVSICFSGFVVQHIHGIGIETLVSHRGKRLAQHVARAYVEDCLSHNLYLYWDCMEENKPSVALAERLNFKLSSEYRGNYFEF